MILKTNLLVLIISFGIISNVFSQEETATPTIKGYATINVTTYSFAPRWTLGYTHALNSRWLLGTEVGYGRKNIVYGVDRGSRRTTSNYKLFEFRPQLYYTFTENPKIRTYISLEFFYINHKDQFNNGEIEYNVRTEDYYEVHYDQADYKRVKTGAVFNFGFYKNVWRNFGLNPVLGVGVRNRNVTYTNIINGQIINPNQEDDHFNFGTRRYLKEAGSNFGFEFNLKLRVYYKF